MEIMVVDDDKDYLDALSSFLKAAGYHCDSFDNPQHALEADNQRAIYYPILITDMKMPTLTGRDLLVLARERKPAQAVIVISENLKPEEKEELLDLGAHAVLDKPIDIKDLLNAIEGCYNDYPANYSNKENL